MNIDEELDKARRELRLALRTSMHKSLDHGYSPYYSAYAVLQGTKSNTRAASGTINYVSKQKQVEVIKSLL